MALRPEFAEACYNLGNVFKAEGKLDEAVGCYRRALALKPGLPQVHANLGSVLQIQDKLDEARLCYEEAVLLQPENAEAHYDLGHPVQRAGQARCGCGVLSTGAGAQAGFSAGAL